MTKELEDWTKEELKTFVKQVMEFWKYANEDNDPDFFMRSVNNLFNESKEQ